MRLSHIACNNGDLKMCKLLDKYQCDWEAEDIEKLTPINYAIRAGDQPTLEFLVKQKKVDIEHKEMQLRTPFY